MWRRRFYRKKLNHSSLNSIQGSGHQIKRENQIDKKTFQSATEVSKREINGLKVGKMSN
tara:strand:+ start:204 stop:380 length:177 start_codon:yes stop_codon:yes gene_type:complete